MIVTGRLFFIMSNYFKKFLLSSLIFLFAGTNLLFASNVHPEKSESKLFLLPLISYSNNSTVYNIYDTDGNLNSRLEWQEKYNFGLGAGLLFEHRQLFFKAGVVFSLPFECGSMYDSDWRTIGLKTNLSKGALFSSFGTTVDMQIGWNFLLKNSFYISPLVCLRERFSIVKAKNLIGYCGDTYHTGLSKDISWDDPKAKKVRKYGIDLYSSLTCFFSGLRIGKAFDKLDFNLSFLISPLSLFLCIDHHLNKEEGSWYQLSQKTIVLDFETAVEYDISQNLAFNASLNYNFCPDRPGDFYFGYFAVENIKADEGCSLKFSTFNLNLGFKIKI